MNNDNYTLDERFRRWSASMQGDDEHHRRLTTRIVNEACRRGRVGESEPTRESFPVLLHRLAWVASIVVAVAVTAVLTAHSWRNGAPPAGPDGGDRWARISEAEAAGNRYLFDEMHRLFQDRLRWMADFNGDVSVGVDELPGGTDADATPIAVRLVVVARNAGEATWRPVWSSDVLLRADERVQIAADGDDAGRMTLWAHSLTDGNVAVEADLHLKTPMCIASVVDAVFADGVATEVAALRSGGREYRVLQSVRVL